MRLSPLLLPHAQAVKKKEATPPRANHSAVLSSPSSRERGINIMRQALSPGSLFHYEVSLEMPCPITLRELVSFAGICDYCESEEGWPVRRVPIEEGFPGWLEGMTMCERCMYEEGLM